MSGNSIQDRIGIAPDEIDRRIRFDDKRQIMEADFSGRRLSATAEVCSDNQLETLATIKVRRQEVMQGLINALIGHAVVFRAD